jgi:hypothetical protein
MVDISDDEGMPKAEEDLLSGFDEDDAFSNLKDENDENMPVELEEDLEP